MAELEIITNHHPRELLSMWEMPKDVLPQFDYIDGDDDQGPRFFRYKGDYYDTHEFCWVGAHGGTNPEWCAWDGYQSDTFFSGLLVKYVQDGFDDMIIVAQYFCRN